MSIKKHIPNFITSLNLAVGCLAIIAIFEGKLDTIIYYILLAGIFDFLDGFAARMLKVTSPIGGDLDSLADMVTFGVVPSLLMFALIIDYSTNEYLPYIALLIAVFSALRLAMFNNDTRQSDAFYGLPTPANALFLGTLPLLMASELPMQWLENQYVLLAIVIIFSLLLIADYKLLALKFKGFGWRNNEFKYILIASGIGLFAGFGIIAFPLIIIIYLVLSVLANTLTGKQ